MDGTIIIIFFSQGVSCDPPHLFLSALVHLGNEELD